MFITVLCLKAWLLAHPSFHFSWLSSPLMAAAVTTFPGCYRAPALSRHIAGGIFPMEVILAHALIASHSHVARGAGCPCHGWSCPAQGCSNTKDRVAQPQGGVVILSSV